jgi:hypothetical protein
MNTKEKEPQEMAEKLLREIGGWFVTSETQRDAFDYCIQKKKESQSDDERDYWDDVSAYIYTHGMNFN